MNQLKTTRREEALATFEHEGVKREVFVLFLGSEGSHYVAAFNEGPVSPQPSDPSVAINTEHKRVKEECLEPVSNPGEVLLDLYK